MPKATNPAHPRRRPSSGSHAVVLVHGILGQNLLYWNFIKRYLEEDRNHFHEIRLPFFGFGDLRRSAHQLGKEIDRILADCADNEEHKVDLIAHSAGGLAARYYVKYLGGADKVHSLVTLGTPHHGTLTGLLFPFSPVAQQTLPGSAFLKELNTGPDTTKDIHYLSLYSLTDGVVLPGKNAVLKGAHNVEVPLATHWSFLWRRQVYAHIQEAIGHAPGDYPRYTVHKGRAKKRSRRRP